MKRLIVSLLIYFYVVKNSLGSKRNAKLVEGVDFKVNDVVYSEGEMEDSETTDPDPLYGPESLYFMNGYCFAKTVGRFDYSICPFQNITQRRSIGQRGHTLIGVWGKWLTSLNTTNHVNGEYIHTRHYNAMRFVDGKSCGDGRQQHSAVMKIKCDYEKDDFEVLEVEENILNSCNFEIILGVPLPCSLFQSPA